MTPARRVASGLIECFPFAPTPLPGLRGAPASAGPLEPARARRRHRRESWCGRAPRARPARRAATSSTWSTRVPPHPPTSYAGSPARYVARLTLAPPTPSTRRRWRSRGRDRRTRSTASRCAPPRRRCRWPSRANRPASWRATCPAASTSPPCPSPPSCPAPRRRRLGGPLLRRGGDRAPPRAAPADRGQGGARGPGPVAAATTSAAAIVDRRGHRGCAPISTNTPSARLAATAPEADRRRPSSSSSRPTGRPMASVASSPFDRGAGAAHERAERPDRRAPGGAARLQQRVHLLQRGHGDVAGRRSRGLGPRW